jgi:hypothetical protein
MAWKAQGTSNPRMMVEVTGTMDLQSLRGIFDPRNSRQRVSVNMTERVPGKMVLGPDKTVQERRWRIRIRGPFAGTAPRPDRKRQRNIRLSSWPCSGQFVVVRPAIGSCILP